MITIKRLSEVENYKKEISIFLLKEESPVVGDKRLTGNAILQFIKPIYDANNSIVLLDNEKIVGCLIGAKGNQTSLKSYGLDNQFNVENELKNNTFIDFLYFYIEKEYRKDRNDYKMCLYAFNNIVKGKYKYITIGVVDSINTHNYWQKFFKFKLLFDLGGAKYYYLDTDTILKEFKIHNKNILLENKIRTLVKEYINPYMLKSKYLSPKDEDKPYQITDKERNIISKWSERSYNRNGINVSFYNINKETLNLNISKIPISAKIIKDNNTKTMQFAVTYSCIINNEKEALITVRSTTKKRFNDKTKITFVLYDNFLLTPNPELILISKPYSKSGNSRHKSDLISLIKNTRDYLSKRINNMLEKGKLLQHPFTKEGIDLDEFDDFFNIDLSNYHIS
jgi:hypothetical protein